jgi:hypothetical protein
MLDEHADSKAIVGAIDEIRKGQTSYREAIKTLLGKLREWQWNDPVSTLYRTLLPSRVVDHSTPDDRLLEDLKYRVQHKIPPGYKDGDKDDEGIGDVAIWHTLVALGKQRRRSVVFVTNETKVDWVVSHGNVVLAPSFELVFEFFHETGHHFSLINFPRFLELVGAKEEVVTDALQITQEIGVELVPAGTGTAKLVLRRLKARTVNLRRTIDQSLEEFGSDQLRVRRRDLDEAFRLFRRWQRKAAERGLLSLHALTLGDHACHIVNDYRSHVNALAESTRPPSGELIGRLLQARVLASNVMRLFSAALDPDEGARQV